MQEFKLFIAGNNSFEDYDRMSLVLYSLADHALADKEVSIVSGKEKPIDELAHAFAQDHHIVSYEIPLDWDTYGNTASFEQVKEVSEHADGVLAFWDGQDIHTKQIIESMKQREKFVHVVTL